ncbi:hypothetical protein EDC40_103335 [Aminobacter aminovorans]|jgi:hypothetical protein|uniref:Transmembrane protein n=1 Tax=Aminobacter aminovorans TaxID=83263 RepID=A0A380WL05_AMIAI|nr:DUF6105 family protein [Aminobacter aminovorans]TCS27869.1 hypothetical protein EDC40_103335 [Aminobacter aminovorans]SUU89719.1 Uncharacterised protein [Aminobacter aminovorans]
MRYIFAVWAAPLVLFWGWYFLSINDLHFGYPILSRALNLAIFDLYGELLGVEAAKIPWMIGKACILDTFILLAIWAFRRRKLIAEKVRGWRSNPRPEMRRVSEAGRVHPAE